jgi:capsular exopolysaccharide synthesis family protein
MSRIDEALMRVAKGTSPERSGGRTDAQLEQYPKEGPSRPSETASASTRARLEQPVRAGFGAGVSRIPDDPESRAKLVTGTDAPGVFVEQYRRLAASLLELKPADGESMSLLVTSALPREGKTLTAVNLALTLSESYERRVLLIDADLRRPTVHEVLRTGNVVGLIDALRSQRTELPVERISPRLGVLTAGRPQSDPMAALTSERMVSILEDARRTYEWIILDAAPAAILPDAPLLSRLVAATLLVIGAGSSPHTMVERAIAEIGRERIIGTVVNAIADHEIPATDYYGYYAAESRR